MPGHCLKYNRVLSSLGWIQPNMNKLHCNTYQQKTFFKENAYENVDCRIASILFKLLYEPMMSFYYRWYISYINIIVHYRYHIWTDMIFTNFLTYPWLFQANKIGPPDGDDALVSCCVWKLSPGTLLTVYKRDTRLFILLGGNNIITLNEIRITTRSWICITYIHTWLHRFFDILVSWA